MNEAWQQFIETVAYLYRVYVRDAALRVVTSAVEAMKAAVHKEFERLLASLQIEIEA